MELDFYNTLNHKKEDFISYIRDLQKESIGIYSCGPKLFENPNLRNLKSFITVDLISNVIKYMYDTDLVSVLGLINNPIIEENASNIHEKIEKYKLDIKKVLYDFEINIDKIGSSYDYTQEQIDLINDLQTKGYAYVIPNDGIYMDTSKLKDHGKLLGSNYKDHINGLKNSTFCTNHEGEKMTLKYSFIEDFKNNNCYESAKTIKAPTLIFHGEKDDVVPIEQSKKISSIIKNCTLKIGIGGGHKTLSQEEFDKMIYDAADFIISNIASGTDRQNNLYKNEKLQNNIQDKSIDIERNQRKFFFKNSNGDNLCGILSNPSGDLSEPIIICCHGLASSKDNKIGKKTEEILTKQNMSTFRFDFSGHGESKGNFEDMTISQAVEDVLSCIDFLKKYGFSKIGLVASSFGGTACLMVASKINDLISLVLMSPASDYIEVEKIKRKTDDFNDRKEKDIENIEFLGKRNITDFLLWKFNGKSENEHIPTLLNGFSPGHSGCYTISKANLGNNLDIYHGGVELIPIHHSNELSQYEAIEEKSSNIFRLHDNYITINGKKMSDANGNIISPYDIIEKGYNKYDIRYWVLSVHYSNCIDFNRNLIKQARVSRENLIKEISQKKSENIFFENEEKYQTIDQKLKTEIGRDFYNKALESIKDDINTVKLLAIINTFLKKANNEVMSIIYWLEKKILKVGLFEKKEESDTPQEIKTLADERIQAKINKNYALADELRNKIKDMGYELKDTKDGYEINKI